MIRTPYHHQTDPAKLPGQWVNPLFRSSAPQPQNLPPCHWPMGPREKK